MINLIRFVSLAALTAGLSYSATVTFTGVNTTLGVGTVNGGSMWMNEDGANFNAYFVGGMDINIDGYSRTVFCMDLFTSIYIGSVNDTTLAQPDAPLVQRAAWVLTSMYADLTAPNVNATSGQLGAAMQLAIWDIIHDGGDGLTLGRVQASTDVNNPTDAAIVLYTQQWISQSVGQGTTDALVYNNFCTGGVPAQYCGVESQSLLGLRVNDGGPSVPEPGTMVAVGWGFLGWGAWRRSSATQSR